MNLTRTIVFILAGLFCFQMMLSADDADFVIKAKFDADYYMRFDAAVCGKSGDVIIIWSASDKSEISTKSIYSAYVKYSKGKFKAKKPKLVSSEEGVQKGRPRIAYNSLTNTFMATWYSNGDVRDAIEGIAMTAKGRKKGQPLEFIDDKYPHDSLPAIVSLHGDAFNNKTGAKFGIVYYKRYLKTLHFILVDATGKLIQEPKEIIKVNGEDPYYPFELLACSNGSLFVTANAHTAAGTRVLLAKFSLEGKPLGYLDMTSAQECAPMLDLGRNRLLCSWFDYDKGNFQTKVVGVKAKPVFKKKAMDPFKGSGTIGYNWGCDFVTTENNRSFLVAGFSSKNNIIEIKSTGKTKGDAKSEYALSDDDFLVLPIVGSDKLLVISLGNYDEEEKTREILGKVIDPDETN